MSTSEVCDLAGEWVPTRANDWRNRNIGMPHPARARMPSTKIKFESDGKGGGMVGEIHVSWAVKMLAPGHYNGAAWGFDWHFNDANLSILNDGTLEVRFPSQGINEYWRRTDGRALEILSCAKEKAAAEKEARAACSSREGQPIKLVFRRAFDSFGLTWHWGLAIGSSIYEVGGLMAVIGPKGLVHATGAVTSVALSGTKLDQFHGYVELKGKASYRSDEEIEQFCVQWVVEHPVYNALGPNCQTFSEDLFVYLTGSNLEFSKSADLKLGPVTSSHAVWLDPSKKPLTSINNAVDAATSEGGLTEVASGVAQAAAAIGFFFM